MNWHLPRRCFACLFCVFVCVLVVFVFAFGFCFGLFVAIRDSLLDCVQVLHQFTLKAPQPADGQLYALIKQLNLFCNMQLNVLNDLAEAMKALDGKKNDNGPALPRYPATAHCHLYDGLLFANGQPQRRLQ